MPRELPLLCERCHKRTARLLLGKGLVVCNFCYQNPEDVVRDLPNPRQPGLDELTRISENLPGGYR